MVGFEPGYYSSPYHDLRIALSEAIRLPELHSRLKDNFHTASSSYKHEIDRLEAKTKMTGDLERIIGVLTKILRVKLTLMEHARLQSFDPATKREINKLVMEIKDATNPAETVKRSLFHISTYFLVDEDINEAIGAEGKKLAEYDIELLLSDIGRSIEQLMVIRRILPEEDPIKNNPIDWGKFLKGVGKVCGGAAVAIPGAIFNTPPGFIGVGVGGSLVANGINDLADSYTRKKGN